VHYVKQTRPAKPCGNVCRIHGCVVIRATTEQTHKLAQDNVRKQYVNHTSSKNINKRKQYVEQCVFNSVCKKEQRVRSNHERMCNEAC
jgi:hypothetical protein